MRQAFLICVLKKVQGCQIEGLYFYFPTYNIESSS